MAQELALVRSAARGRPIANPEAAATARQLRKALQPLAWMRDLNGEARGVAVLDTMLRLRMGAVLPVLAVPVARIEREYRIAGRYFVDRALFHADGGVTLIEAKDGATPREVVAGIGQALIYKAALERTGGHPRIDTALAVLHDPDEDIARACALAGVVYLPLGSVAWARAMSHVAEFAADGPDC